MQYWLGRIAMTYIYYNLTESHLGYGWGYKWDQVMNEIFVRVSVAHLADYPRPGFGTSYKGRRGQQTPLCLLAQFSPKLNISGWGVASGMCALSASQLTQVRWLSLWKWRTKWIPHDVMTLNGAIDSRFHFLFTCNHIQLSKNQHSCMTWMNGCQFVLGRAPSSASPHSWRTTSTHPQ